MRFRSSTSPVGYAGNEAQKTLSRFFAAIAACTLPGHARHDHASSQSACPASALDPRGGGRHPLLTRADATTHARDATEGSLSGNSRNRPPRTTRNTLAARPKWPWRCRRPRARPISRPCSRGRTAPVSPSAPVHHRRAYAARRNRRCHGISRVPFSLRVRPAEVVLWPVVISPAATLTTAACVRRGTTRTSSSAGPAAPPQIARHRWLGVWFPATWDSHRKDFSDKLDAEG